MDSNIIGVGQVDKEGRVSSFITSVYGLMTGALAITGLVAWYISEYTDLVAQVGHYFLPLMLFQVVIVIALSAGLRRMPLILTRILFVAYSVLSGLVFGVIFSFFTRESIASTFFITAGTFGVMSAYGYYTKKDLTSIGRILRMAFVGLLIATVVNWFLYSPALYWISTYAGVIIFVGLIAYDTQKLKALAEQTGYNEASQKLAIMGAFMLYLDFINLFLFLLRIFGSRR